MTDLRTAAQQALEALEHIDSRDNDSDFLQPHECYQLDAAITALRAALEQPEHEPKPCPTCQALARAVMMDQTGYDIPPRREWRGLTDEEIEDLYFDEFSLGELQAFARAIEAKLKEKNRE